MNPGELNKKIVLEIVASGSVDVYGDSIDTYTTSSIWANVKEDGGDKISNGGMVKTGASYTFTIWENDSVTENSFIYYKNNRYRIDFISNPEPNIMKVTGVRVLNGS